MRMLRHLAVLSVAVGLTVAACDDDDPVEPEAEVYTATLTGANETPPVTTTATGTGTFTVTGNNINYVITIANWPAGRTVTAAHIHNRPIRPDTAAGVLLGWPGGSITVTGGSGTIAATDAQLTAIRAGGTYFNVHSSVNAGGEIRGNLVAQ
ncbi:MAG TPA: CHRD domain-containing protein [Gemmatimonadaceae bacterium]|nr:CHRD domain-containing protein [Gemmatimonadaceae bacterium]